MAVTNTKTTTEPPKHHYLRTLLAVMLGSLAATFVITSVTMYQLGKTITDTDTYVAAVGPIVSDPGVQEFTVEKVSAGLLEAEGAPVQDVATQLLGAPNVSGKSVDQLREEVRPLVEDTVRGVVASESFATLWETTNRDLHSTLVTQLDSEGSTVNLNFRPVITGVVDQLGGTRLAFVKDQLEIKDDVGKVELKGEQIQQARDGYDKIKSGYIVIAVIALALVVLAVVVSTHHLKTFRRVAITTGTFAGITALLLGATSLVNPEGTDAVSQKLAIALFDAVTGNLRSMMITIAVLCFLAAAGTKIFEIVKAKQVAAK